MTNALDAMRDFSQDATACHADKGSNGEIDALGELGGAVGAFLVGGQALQLAYHVVGRLLRLAASASRAAGRGGAGGSQHCVERVREEGGTDLFGRAVAVLFESVVVLLWSLLVAQWMDGRLYGTYVGVRGNRVCVEFPMLFVSV